MPVGGTIVWPVTGGTWEVMQGYNGSSHQNNSSFWQYLYSLDIARDDGQTRPGASAFAPVSGTVRWYERASGGITIDMGNGYAVAMFHLTVDRGWEPGDTIQQGDFIGTISPPGGEGFVQVPHIHLTLWQTNDGGNLNRVAAPVHRPVHHQRERLPLERNRLSSGPDSSSSRSPHPFQPRPHYLPRR